VVEVVPAAPVVVVVGSLGPVVVEVVVSTVVVVSTGVVVAVVVGTVVVGTVVVGTVGVVVVVDSGRVVGTSSAAAGTKLVANAATARARAILERVVGRGMPPARRPVLDFHIVRHIDQPGAELRAGRTEQDSHGSGHATYRGFENVPGDPGTRVEHRRELAAVHCKHRRVGCGDDVRTARHARHSFGRCLAYRLVEGDQEFIEGKRGGSSRPVPP
jgi:hypothetical protein